jgi:hypothetical protein
MSSRTGHPRVNFVDAIEVSNLGNHLSSLAREKLQYLAHHEDNSVDVAQFKFALEDLLDTTPNARAVLARHRARDAREKAHAKTFEK